MSKGFHRRDGLVIHHTKPCIPSDEVSRLIQEGRSPPSDDDGNVWLRYTWKTILGDFRAELIRSLLLSGAPSPLEYTGLPQDVQETILAALEPLLGQPDMPAPLPEPQQVEDVGAFDWTGVDLGLYGLGPLDHNDLDAMQFD